MQSASKNNWQEWWVSVLLVLLLIGLLVSRAIVSFASVLIVVPFFFKQQKVKPLHFIAPALLLFPVLALRFVERRQALWWNSVSIKLPLLTMLLGLCSVTLSEMRWKQLVFIFLLIVLVPDAAGAFRTILLHWRKRICSQKHCPRQWTMTISVSAGW
jgi:hypothetical protein